VFSLRRPTDEEACRYLEVRAAAPLTYPEVGASRGSTAPPGYRPSHARTLLGEGEETWRCAVRAVRRWAMYDMPWVDILWTDTPIEVGRVVAVRVRHYGFWSLHACRIVYVTDEPRRFGFGYGTVADHAQRGEERFTVEWGEDGRVHYELFAFSRPAAPLARLGYPLSRRLQKRFARESLLAMAAAVEQFSPRSRS
jgi:uncharacterized protein (UPF0548 family)